MEIALTPEQWHVLYPLVLQARQSEKTLGLPLEIDNGNQKVEMTVDEVKITLSN